MLVHDWESVTTQPCGPQSRDGATPAPSPQIHPQLQKRSGLLSFEEFHSCVAAAGTSESAPLLWSPG